MIFYAGEGGEGGDNHKMIDFGKMHEYKVILGISLECGLRKLHSTYMISLKKAYKLTVRAYSR